MKPKLSVIIVAYNSSQHIKNMLLSIEKQTKTAHEIIIVDNNSLDQTIAQIYASKVKVSLLKQKENLGFSKANNLGVKNSIGEYLMFLNPDTFLMNSALDQLTGFIEDNKDVGLVAPQLIDDSGNPQLSVRKFPSIVGAIKEYYFCIRNSYEPYAHEGDDPVEVDSIVGAAMLIPKSVYLNAGGFNDKYFMYYEDIELCKKINQLGYKIMYLPYVKVKHSVGASAKTNPKSASYLKQAAYLYHGGLSYYLLQLLLRLRRSSPFFRD